MEDQKSGTLFKFQEAYLKELIFFAGLWSHDFAETSGRVPSEGCSFFCVKFTTQYSDSFFYNSVDLYLKKMLPECW